MSKRVDPIVVVHGGASEWYAGTALGRAACRRAAQAGWETLAAGGSALDAVIAAVRIVEDDPECNAGTGAVLTSRGTLELDACVMDGASRASGAVAVLPPFRNPVDIARAVLEDGRYHLLVGDGAAAFARARGFTPCDPTLMITPDRRAEFEGRGSFDRGNTVGAVALDANGHLAAATSTGGIAGTDPGRVGDAPLVGGGTYADEHAACSCTGDGEAYARACAAFWTVENVAKGAQAAAERSVARVRERYGGYGGLILVDKAGGVGIARSASAMPHAIARSDGSITDRE
ncbi:MAG: L-asparaginase / beta-aspartyl-peptidase [Solirubrobacteraceae bacterium]|nr:L-asparaginase / beta-aspartyl-peptidase [Solirubrobacteraceae bacterium]